MLQRKFHYNCLDNFYHNHLVKWEIHSGWQLQTIICLIKYRYHSIWKNYSRWTKIIIKQQLNHADYRKNLLAILIHIRLPIYNQGFFIINIKISVFITKTVVVVIFRGKQVCKIAEVKTQFCQVFGSYGCFPFGVELLENLPVFT